MTHRPAALIVLVAAATLLAAAGASSRHDAGDRSAAQPRPFRHATHEAIACGECHGVGAEHRAARDWTAADCAACHHDPARSMTCAQCHEAARYAPPRPVGLELSLSVRERAIVRSVSFDHERHAAFACVDCHSAAAGIFLTPPACSTCHERHHDGQAQCSACHAPAPAGTHGLTAHATCGGAGCHGVAADRQPTLSREMCLFCHDEQRAHEIGRACHDCHLVPYRPD